MKNKLLSLIATSAMLFANNLVNGQNFLKVTRANQEQTISLTTDQVLEIQLPRKSSTGYIWVESTAPSDKIQKTIARIGDDDFIHDATTNQIGGSGTQIIRYVGTSQGATTLTLELKRPTAKINTTMDSYTITIVSTGKYTGTYTPPVKEVRKLDAPLTLTPLSGIPASWDWRSQCTEVENQDMCGDCWAFATVGPLECNILEVDGVTRDISEEFVTDCYTASGYSGCNGTSNSTKCQSFQCWLSTYKGANSNGGGAVYETEDYTTCTDLGNTGTCHGPYTPHETIKSYNKIGGSGTTLIDSMQYHIYHHGPIYVEVDASSNNFSAYTGGIYVESGTSTDHCVDLVGWKDTTVSDGSGGYWILRNSWGYGPDIQWGVDWSGYMYISYGSDAVETAASYLVYKGGPSHGAPIAHFTDLADTVSCFGTVQFTDESVSEPTSWSWNFGDGGTSSLENPSHTYTTSGTYTVSLTVFNTSGSNTTTKTSYINTTGQPAAPSVTSGSTSSGGSVTLNASGSSTLEWFNAPVGGTLVNTGTSYTISPLTTNDTFYVESDVAQTAQAVGPTAKTTHGGYYTAAYRQGVKFDVYAPIIIKSVNVYEQTAGTRTIVVTNSAGVEVDSLTTAVSTGTQTVTLNFNVPAGTGYTMWAAASSSFWRDTLNAVYPYTISNVMSITENTIDDNWHYYFFYNWQVEPLCISPRVPVMATIITGLNDISEGNFNIYPNPNSGSFDIKLNDQNIKSATISISNTLGQTLFNENILNNNSPIHVESPNLPQGMYYVKIQTDKSTYIRKVLISN
jgi:PKD repeat protein/predicted secreted protein